MFLGKQKLAELQMFIVRSAFVDIYIQRSYNLNLLNPIFDTPELNI